MHSLGVTLSGRSRRGVLLLGLALAFLPVAARAEIIARVVGADEVLRSHTRTSGSELDFIDALGASWNLVTTTRDPSITNPGSGSFHPPEAADVRAALAQVSLPGSPSVDVQIFLLPYPRRDLMPSSADGQAIYLSPGVYPYAPEQVHALVVHELGHVLHLRYLPDSDAAGWLFYRQLRGITDVALFNDRAAHRNRPHEIFAEDFRVLFGGALANYSGSIENASLVPPDQVPGLSQFFLDLLGVVPGPTPGTPLQIAAWPNPFTMAATIRFTLPPGRRQTSVDIIDSSGRLVRRFAATTRDGDEQALIWDGRNDGGERVAAGAYFVRVDAGSRQATLKLILAR